MHKQSKRPSNAQAAVMESKLALFRALTPRQREEWSQSRLAAYCGVSWDTMHLWTGRPRLDKRNIHIPS